jgi:hypothetical protein
MTKPFFSVSAFLIRLFSCTLRPKFFVVEIPHNYQGYIVIVFGSNTKNPTKLERKRIYLNLRADSIVFLSNEFKQEYKTLPLVALDSETKMDINLSDLDISYRKIFDQKIQEISTKGKKITVCSFFITNKFYQEDDSTVQKLMDQKRSQYLDFGNK